MKNLTISLFPGIFLIGLGLLLLFHKLNLFYFDWSRTYPMIFMLIGVTLLISSIMNKISSAIFWGTIFFLIGILFFLRNFNFIDYYYIHDIWPTFLIIFGIAFVILFIVNPKDWGVLIPGTILLFFGTTFLFKNFHYWRAQELIQRYWPLILIVIGIGIILGSLKKKIE